MIKAAYINEVADLIAKLPDEDGIVTQSVRELPNGDSTTIYGIEWQGQTILLEMVFDSDEEVDKAFANLLAKGGSLLRYFAGKAIANDEELTNLLSAFNITFNALAGKNKELEDELNKIEEEKDPPTVGEK